MSNKRPLVIGAGLVAAIGTLLLLFTQQPAPVPVRPTPIVMFTPSFGVTPGSVTPVAQLLPTVTPTPQPTPVPTKPRPGYTPVPDNVVSPVVVDQSPAPGEEARPDGSIQISFDRAMDRSAVESAFQVYPSIKGSFTWSNDQTVVFKPDSSLTRDGLYDVVIDQRAKARDQKLFMRFLSLSSKAQEYYCEMEKRRFNPRHHLHKIVALSEIYGEDAVDRAIRMPASSRLSPLNTSPISSNSAPEPCPNPALSI